MRKKCKVSERVRNICIQSACKQGLCNQNAKQTPLEWTVAQMKTMAMRYKQADNIPLPTTMKQLLLTRYHGHMIHVNAAVLVATVMPPLTHPSVALISRQDMMGGPPV